VPHFGQFANKGWPHFTAMQELMPSKSKGTHAHQGTQLVTGQPEVGASPSVTSTPSQVPISSKHGFSLLDDTSASPSISSGKRPRTTSATMPPLVQGLKSSINNFHDTFRDAVTTTSQSLVQLSHRSEASRRPPQPPQDALSLAVKYLIESIEGSKDGPWLSQDNVQKAFDLFNDQALSSMYVQMVTTVGGEKYARMWLKRKLTRAGLSESPSAPGDASSSFQ
jgi:hypothetical protein